MRFNLKYYILALLISSTFARAQNPIPNQKINLTSSSSYKEMKKQYIIEQTIENIAENNAADNGIRLIMIKALATFVLATAKINVIFEKRMNKAFITPGIPIL